MHDNNTPPPPPPNKQSARYLLDCGARVDGRGKLLGQSVLHVSFASPETTKLLLLRGAPTTIRNNNGETPLENIQGALEQNNTHLRDDHNQRLLDCHDLIEQCSTPSGFKQFRNRNSGLIELAIGMAERDWPVLCVIEIASWLIAHNDEFVALHSPTEAWAIAALVKKRAQGR